MTAANILLELERLPLIEKLFVIERTLQSIRIKETQDLKEAVDNLYEDYKTDPELTAFNCYL